MDIIGASENAIDSIITAVKNVYLWPFKFFYALPLLMQYAIIAVFALTAIFIVYTAWKRRFDWLEEWN